MLFNSFAFLFLFLPAVSATYYFCARRFPVKVRQAVLVTFSLAFYTWAKAEYTVLLIASILFNYAFAKKIHSASTPWRKRWLVFALAANITVLAIFKYLAFLLASFTFLWKPGFVLPDWSFPLGISFYTLQQVMYLVDCYERLVGANDLLTHAAFVSFFPYVISGPITRARDMVPQIRRAATTDARKVTEALILLGIGLFKKVVLADSFSRIADAGFNSPLTVSTLEAWVSSFSYTFQIYFDFSGYTDMALAAALLLGYSLPVNFTGPYRSLSIIEFWQRWHITLSQFITTYLYTPIVRLFSRVTLAKASLATLLAMTLAGLWHGPSWTFVVFGALHGIALVINQFWRRKIKRKLNQGVSWVATLAFVNFAFIFFRAPNLAAALDLCRALLPQSNLLGSSTFQETLALGDAMVLTVPVVVGLICAFAGQTSTDLSLHVKPTPVTALAVSLLILIALVFMNSTVAQDFIYFKF